MKIVQKVLYGLKNPLKIITFFLGFRICYSQTGEDLILEHVLDKEEGFYIDIGANHPVHFNNTYFLYRRGWNGINVEPNKKLISKFMSKRSKDINLHIACGDNKINKKLDFYEFKPHTLSTCDASTASEYINMGHILVDKYSVPIISLAEIIKQYGSGREIDLLSIDVEGYDMEVLKTNDWSVYRPKYIILETLQYKNDGTGKKFNHIYDPFFEDKKYEKFADTYINTIYKRKD